MRIALVQQARAIFGSSVSRPTRSSEINFSCWSCLSWATCKERSRSSKYQQLQYLRCLSGTSFQTWPSAPWSLPSSSPTLQRSKPWNPWNLVPSLDFVNGAGFLRTGLGTSKIIYIYRMGIPALASYLWCRQLILSSGPIPSTQKGPWLLRFLVMQLQQHTFKSSKKGRGCGVFLRIAAWPVFNPSHFWPVLPRLLDDLHSAGSA